MQVIILHKLSKIQPHVNIALCVLKFNDDTDEIDLSGRDYEFIRQREVRSNY